MFTDQQTLSAYNVLVQYRVGQQNFNTFFKDGRVQQSYVTERVDIWRKHVGRNLLCHWCSWAGAV